MKTKARPPKLPSGHKIPTTLAMNCSTTYTTKHTQVNLSLILKLRQWEDSDLRTLEKRSMVLSNPVPIWQCNVFPRPT